MTLILQFHTISESESVLYDELVSLFRLYICSFNFVFSISDVCFTIYFKSFKIIYKIIFQNFLLHFPLNLEIGTLYLEILTLNDKFTSHDSLITLLAFVLILVFILLFYPRSYSFNICI